MLLLLLPSCKRPAPAAAEDERKSSDAITSIASSDRSPTARRAEPNAQVAVSSDLDRKREDERADGRRYQWLTDDKLKAPDAASALSARFAAPPGYERVAVDRGSFAEWLRDVPLAAPHAPVLSNSGETIFKGDDAHVAAVLAIDIGVGDLQQSADAVVRLHAEWRWSAGALQALSYRSATRLDMPFSRWAKGQRLLASGPNVFWVVKGKAREPTYHDFRQYIDAVMLWSNNVSLAASAEKVTDPEALKPGDFFVQARGAGHAVLVLDVARKPTGERVALLGEALQSPAQSIHVLQLGPGVAWFSLRPPNALLTPHGDEFAWSELMRLPSP